MGRNNAKDDAFVTFIQSELRSEGENRQNLAAHSWIRIPECGIVCSHATLLITHSRRGGGGSSERVSPYVS